MDNAIFVTCVYDKLTWQNMALELYRSYCKNSGCDLVVVDDKSDNINRLVLPRGDTNFLKIAMIMDAAESSYDKVLFADIDMLVNPSYKNCFEDIDESSIYINGRINARDEIKDWLNDRKGGEPIIWPYYKFRYADNFLGEQKKRGVTSWNTCHSMNREWCKEFVSFLDDNDLLPVSENNSKNISDLCMIDGEEKFMTDEILMEIFVDRHLDNFKKITWPHKSHFEVPSGEPPEFMIDFWNVPGKRMYQTMKKWYNLIKNS